MLVGVAAVTVIAAVFEIVPEVAVMVTLPTAWAVARPLELMVASVVLLEDQVTDVVRFCVPPSLIVPIALYCCVVPLASETDCGVTAIEVRTALPTTRFTFAFWFW